MEKNNKKTKEGCIDCKGVCKNSEGHNQECNNQSSSAFGNECGNNCSNNCSNDCSNNSSNDCGKDGNINCGTNKNKKLNEVEKSIAEAKESKSNKTHEEEPKENNIAQLQRLQAEFENYIKRAERERNNFVGTATKDVMKKLIVIVDDFENALKQMKEGSDKEGINMIYKNLVKLLESEGVKKIKCIGEKFDPYKHEVMRKEESKQKEGTVIGEIQPGYMIQDKILRYSKVIIAK